MVGGERECLILNKNTVLKRGLRMISTPDFDVIDNYHLDDIDQQLVEYQALKFIHKNAPDKIRKFFPSLICAEKIKLTKPTYLDTVLQTKYGYIAGASTTLSDLQNFPEAELLYEFVLEIERVTPVEDLPIEIQKSFLKKGINFHSFSKHINPVVDSYELEQWLLERQSNDWKTYMDYMYISSNWGVRMSDNHPVILDLGYFFLGENNNSKVDF